MVRSTVPVDTVFAALASPVRRQVLERLAAGPAAVTELAQPFGMALPSFVQHLAVLERSRLVTSVKQGRVRTYALAPDPLQAAEDWLAERRRCWDARLDGLAHLAERLHAQEESHR